jgi:hypothetical protein
VAEFHDVKEKSRKSGVDAHFARCHMISTVKNSEAAVSDQIDKGRLVYGGDRVSDQEGAAPDFTSFGHAPAALAAIRTTVCYGMTPGNDTVVLDAERAYLQSWLPGLATYMDRVAARGVVAKLAREGLSTPSGQAAQTFVRSCFVRRFLGGARKDASCGSGISERGRLAISLLQSLDQDAPQPLRRRFPLEWSIVESCSRRSKVTNFVQTWRGEQTLQIFGLYVQRQSQR